MLLEDIFSLFTLLFLKHALWEILNKFYYSCIYVLALKGGDVINLKLKRNNDGFVFLIVKIWIYVFLTSRNRF